MVVMMLGQVSVLAKKQKTLLITDLNEIKEFKKLLKTKTNILVLFVNESKSAQAVADVFRNAADVMKGQATLVIVNCSVR